METTEVFPPHGFVKLDAWMGTEVSVVNAARVSFHKEIDELESADQALINFLVKNRHGTPFEQGFQSTWHIRMPIFVMREWARHRIGHSINEESGRYVELRQDFYVPDFVRKQEGKPGSYQFAEHESEHVREETKRLIIEQSEQAYEKYAEMIAMGVAKEQARIVLPLNLYTEIRWTANARSLMHFIGLRNEPNAMFEIREYAKKMECIFAKHMPYTHQAFVSNGRVAP